MYHTFSLECVHDKYIAFIACGKGTGRGEKITRHKFTWSIHKGDSVEFGQTVKRLKLLMLSSNFEYINHKFIYTG